MVLGVKGSLSQPFLHGKAAAGSELALGMLGSSVQVWLGGLSPLIPAVHRESRCLAQEVSELPAAAAGQPAARVKSGHFCWL